MKNRTGNVKKSAFLITFFLLFAASAAHASGIASLHEKVFSYIDNNKELKPLINKQLWFTYSEPQPDAETYANKVISSKTAINSMGDNAVLAYGGIYTEDPHISFTNENTGAVENFGLVDSTYEYYFTDLVFIQEKYEEALIDLYLFKAEKPFNLKTIDEVIQGTYWIAEQNGVKLSKEQILASFTKELDKRAAVIERELNVKVGKHFPITTKYSSKIAQATKEYYLDPNNDTYNKWKNSFFALIEAIQKGPTVYIEGVNMSKHMDIGLLTSVLQNASGLYVPSFSDNSYYARHFASNSK